MLMLNEEKKLDYQTHVFTSTYTADVSGVCSAMYELGGMTILHDPSGCNSTYSTHDEPRWFDTDSLMFVSGLDEMTAVLGDDNVIIGDVAHAAEALKPRFITLCGGSIPHIIAFDYKGVAHLIEKRTGIPVIPVPTDGLKSYVSGVGMALTNWIKRFADPAESGWISGDGKAPELSVNLLGVTPLDFSVNGNAEALRKAFEDEGIPVNCCAAMGEDFDSMSHICRAAVNVVVSSAGRRPARYLERLAGLPRVEGVPIGDAGAGALAALVRKVYGRRAAGQETAAVSLFAENPAHGRWSLPEDQILIIGEEIFAQSLAAAVNRLPASERFNRTAYAIWPDINMGFPEEYLTAAMKNASVVIADPLYKAVPAARSTCFIDFPHEAYSGRIFRKDIPVFASNQFDLAGWLNR